VIRCVRSLVGWVVLRLRCVGRWPATGDDAGIGHIGLIVPLSEELDDRRCASWWPTLNSSGWLKEAYPGVEEMWVSHETIYLSLFVQGRGALRHELTACLRTHRAIRHPATRRAPTGKGQIREPVMISERPAEAEDRAVPGPAYPTVCIPSPPPDLDCGQISYRNFKVLAPDPHRFDGDNDGIGCET